MAEKMIFPEWEIYEQELEGCEHPVLEMGRGLEIHAGSPTDDGESLVCTFYEHMGPCFVQFPDAERNALLVAAAPKLLQELLAMVRKFKFPAQMMGPDYQEAVASAYQAIRLTMTSDEQVAEIGSVVADATGKLQ